MASKWGLLSLSADDPTRKDECADVYSCVWVQKDHSEFTEHQKHGKHAKEARVRRELFKLIVLLHKAVLL